jgi:hypothetical protein
MEVWLMGEKTSEVLMQKLSRRSSILEDLYAGKIYL